MTGHRTTILLLLTVLAAAGMLLAMMRLNTARASALNAEHDEAVVHRGLSEIAKTNAGGPQLAFGQLNTAELQRRLTSAAVDAGAVGHLVDIESGPPARLGNSDFDEMQINLRFDKISLRELATFFDRLAAADPGSRVKSIELASPETLLGGTGTTAAPGDAEEKWTAFIGVAYLVHSPPKDAKR